MAHRSAEGELDKNQRGCEQDDFFQERVGEEEVPISAKESRAGADGEDAQPELCQQKGIQGYPTWEIEGQLYPGVKSLADLAELSGFSAPQ